jgi:L-rhamnose mutarotase
VKRLCQALDLKDDPSMIEEYEDYHRQVWPEILQSIRDAGILDMEIYLIGCRLFMVMEVEDSFTFEAKAALDEANPKVREWEALMWRYQCALPQAVPGQKWVPLERVFSLAESAAS